MNKDIMSDILSLPDKMKKFKETDVIVRDCTYRGYNTIAVRTGMGHWCGYVEVPEAHPDHG